MKYLHALGWGSVAGIFGCFALGSVAGMLTFMALGAAGMLAAWVVREQG